MFKSFIKIEMNFILFIDSELQSIIVGPWPFRRLYLDLVAVRQISASIMLF